MLPWYQHIPFFSIVLMMICGILTSVLPSGRAALRLHLTAVLVLLGGNLALLSQVLPRGERFEYALGIVGHPFGNELICGPLEATLASVFLLVMAMSVLGGKSGIFDDVEPGKQNLYFVMCDLIMASLLAMVYTNDAFTAYVFIEINTISACALVMAKDSGATLVATIRYLMMSLLGSGLFLMGLTFLYHITGHLLIPDIYDQVQRLAETGAYAIPLTVLMGMMALGLGLKSALFPNHTWLPDAHGSATTASSAILSGLVLKGYIVLLIKCIFCVFGEEVFAKAHVGDVLLVMGAAAMVVGSVRAIQETHIKRMIAYSSVAQIGYIYLALGLGGRAAAVAALYQIVVHAFTKPLLFLCAGELAEASGHRKQMYYLRGAGHRAKLAGVCFTVGGLSMVGLPLLGGFAVKFYLADAALAGGWKLWLALTALAASSVLNALYYLPAIVQIWTNARPEEGLPVLPVKKPSFSFVLSALVLTAGSVLLGVCCGQVGDLLSFGLGLL